MCKFLNDWIELYSGIGHTAIIERFVVRNGRPYTAKKYQGRLMTIKQCFKNATEIALRDPSLTYVEGFIASADIPLLIHHAWLNDGNTYAVDPTLRQPLGYEYFGVEIPRSDLIHHLQTKKIYGVLDCGMINVEYMFGRDPNLKETFETFKSKTF